MSNAKNNIIHVRLDDDDKARLERLRIEYQCASAAETIRYALAHIDRTKPTWLGAQNKTKRIDWSY